MNAFVFDEKPERPAEIVAEIPAGLSSKQELLATIASALRFPSYFGHNWDALDECLTDLSWLPAGDVIVIHRDLPLAMDSEACSIYLSILWDAAQRWKQQGSNLFFASWNDQETIAQSQLAHRHLSFSFPHDLRTIVESRLPSE